LPQASLRQANFIGMCFYSPAEKMPLVEIICGEQTSDQTLATAFDLAQQLGKTPIVVNDAPGFFTTRVTGKTVSQGAEMLEQGVNPVLRGTMARRLAPWVRLMKSARTPPTKMASRREPVHKPRGSRGRTMPSPGCLSVWSMSLAAEVKFMVVVL